MRRVLVATLVATVISATGCSTESGGAGTGSAGGPARDATAAATATALPPDAQAACDAVAKVSAESGRTIQGALAAFAAAKATNDAAAITKAEDQVDKALTEWSGKLSGQAEKITSSNVRQPVADLATAVTDLAQQEEGVDVAAIADLQREAESICN